MNRIDDQLGKLFRAAAPTATAWTQSPARTRAADLATPPYGMESRVLAAWRESAQMPAGFWDMGLLMRGLILAVALMALSLWPAVQSLSANPDADYQQLADATVQLDDSP